MERTLLTKLALWWIRNYEHCVQFWAPFMFCSVMCALFIGVSKGIPLPTLCYGIFAGGMILNVGLYFLIRTLKSHLSNLPEGPDREAAHKEMVNIILRRIKRGY